MPNDLREPPDSSRVDLRETLKTSTLPRHKRLDSLLSSLDLGNPADRRTFREIQYRGFSRLGAACGWDAAEATHTLSWLVRSLQTDLDATGGTEAEDAPMAADAVAYVTLGSQLGLAVLRRTVPEDARTGIFGVAPDARAWRDFLGRLAANPPPDPERVLADAGRAFDIFLAEAYDHLQKKTDDDR